jgi:shikimate kinase
VSPVAVMVGPPGAGKTTVGGLLAARLGVPFRDNDDDVEATAGKTITEIFADDGEPAFRALERAAVLRNLAEHDGVLGLGGGAVLAEQTREALRGHTVVFLCVGMPEGVRRTSLSSARPLLAGVNPRARYKAMLEARLPIYREVATIEVDTNTRNPDEVVDAIVTELTPSRAAR